MTTYNFWYAVANNPALLEKVIDRLTDEQLWEVMQWGTQPATVTRSSGTRKQATEEVTTPDKPKLPPIIEEFHIGAYTAKGFKVFSKQDNLKSYLRDTLEKQLVDPPAKQFVDKLTTQFLRHILNHFGFTEAAANFSYDETFTQALVALFRISSNSSTATPLIHELNQIFQTLIPEGTFRISDVTPEMAEKYKEFLQRELEPLVPQLQELTNCRSLKFIYEPDERIRHQLGVRATAPEAKNSYYTIYNMGIQDSLICSFMPGCSIEGLSSVIRGLTETQKREVKTLLLRVFEKFLEEFDALHTFKFMEDDLRWVFAANASIWDVYESRAGIRARRR